VTFLQMDDAKMVIYFQINCALCVHYTSFMPSRVKSTLRDAFCDPNYAITL